MVNKFSVKYATTSPDEMFGTHTIREKYRMETETGAKNFTREIMKDFLDGKINLEFIETVFDDLPEIRLQKILYQFDSKYGIYSVFTKLSDGDMDHEVFTNYDRALEYYKNTIKLAQDNDNNHIQYVVFGFSHEISKADRLIDIDENHYYIPCFKELIKDRWGLTSDAFMIDQWFNPKYFDEKEKE